MNRATRDNTCDGDQAKLKGIFRKKTRREKYIYNT